MNEASRTDPIAAETGVAAPNLYFIGGMRCGSTTLYLLLSQHPDIFMSPAKEPGFWSAEARRRKGRETPADARMPYRTAESYAGLFADAGDEALVGEASHYLYLPETAAMIREASPDAQIIVSLRDPVDRLFSEYLNRRRGGHFAGSFEAYIQEGATIEPDGTIQVTDGATRLRKSRQAALLTPWLDTFGPDRILLLFFEELESAPLATARRIYDWLGVDAGFEPTIVHTQRGGIPKSRGVIKALNTRWGPLKLVRRYMPRLLRERIRAMVYEKTLSRPEMKPETERALRAYYRDDVTELETLTGTSLTRWKTGRVR
jgi:hypothetical protein